MHFSAAENMQISLLEILVSVVKSKSALHQHNQRANGVERSKKGQPLLKLSLVMVPELDFLVSWPWLYSQRNILSGNKEAKTKIVLLLWMINEDSLSAPSSVPMALKCSCLENVPLAIGLKEDSFPLALPGPWLTLVFWICLNPLYRHYINHTMVI